MAVKSAAVALTIPSEATFLPNQCYRANPDATRPQSVPARSRPEPRSRAARSGAGAQLELGAVVAFVPVEAKRRGGRRAGAGRKPVKGRRPNVPHRRRPRHAASRPVHVTLRARSGLPSLRSERIYGMFNSVVRDQRKRRYAGSFQVVEFTVQQDHLHLIVEARGPEAHRELRAGVSGLVIAFAKRLNMMLRRRGKVWGDRWHGRELGSPREVRNALVYVFRNLAKHGTRMIGQDLVDVRSSALRFQGWTSALTFHVDDHLRWPHAPPRTWLLEDGWITRGGGRIDPREVRQAE
jgi:putative transposase